MGTEPWFELLTAWRRALASERGWRWLEVQTRPAWEQRSTDGDLQHISEVRLPEDAGVAARVWNSMGNKGEH